METRPGPPRARGGRGRAALLAGLLASACTAPPPADAVAASASAVSAAPCDRFPGRRPVLFDDFAYAGAEATGSIHPAGSLFGENAWETCDGRRDSRMWYRWTHDGQGFTPGSTVDATDAGTVVLGMDRGAVSPSGVDGSYPMIVSGTDTFLGTYAARVRFSDLPHGGSAPRVIASFWTMVDEELRDRGEARFGELDVEFNNWFSASEGTHRPELHVVNHGPDGQTGARLDCLRDDGGAVSGSVGCLADGAGSLIVGDGAGGRYERAWWTVAVSFGEHEGRRSARYAAWSDDGSVWAGPSASASGWGEPVEIAEDLPQREMNLLFGVLPESDRALPRRVELEVDWVLFTPEVGVSAAAIQREVAALRGAGLVRVNTTGTALDRVD